MKKLGRWLSVGFHKIIGKIINRKIPSRDSNTTRLKCQQSKLLRGKNDNYYMYRLVSDSIF